MPRVTHVKAAQQRYRTVPVLDPATGEPKRTPVINKRTGKPKVTKTGREVTMKVTVADKSQPLPELSCDFPGCTINDGKIAVGTAYKHITPKSGPYGGRQRNRHEEHPNWNVWEYSSSLSAMVAQAQSNGGDSIANLAEVDDFESVRDDLASMAQELLDEKQESLDNMPEGLGEGSMLAEQVEALESWVQEIESAEAPDEPEAEFVTKWFVTGPDEQSLNEEGFDDEDEAQQALSAFLAEHEDESEDDWSVDSEETDEEGEVSEEDLEEWLDQAREVLQEALDSFEG
jgi:hypothetical protein